MCFSGLAVKLLLWCKRMLVWANNWTKNFIWQERLTNEFKLYWMWWQTGFMVGFMLPSFVAIKRLTWVNKLVIIHSDIWANKLATVHFFSINCRAIYGQASIFLNHRVVCDTVADTEMTLMNFFVLIFNFHKKFIVDIAYRFKATCVEKKSCSQNLGIYCFWWKCGIIMISLEQTKLLMRWKLEYLWSVWKVGDLHLRGYYGA